MRWTMCGHTTCTWSWELCRLCTRSLHPVTSPVDQMKAVKFTMRLHGSNLLQSCPILFRWNSADGHLLPFAQCCSCNILVFSTPLHIVTVISVTLSYYWYSGIGLDLCGSSGTTLSQTPVTFAICSSSGLWMWPFCTWGSRAWLQTQGSGHGSCAGSPATHIRNCLGAPALIIFRLAKTERSCVIFWKRTQGRIHIRVQASHFQTGTVLSLCSSWPVKSLLWKVQGREIHMIYRRYIHIYTYNMYIYIHTIIYYNII